MIRRSIAAFCLLAAALLVASCRRGPRDLAVPSADGVTIAYHLEGSGDPALVFVHGWCCDGNFWNAQIPVFAGTHKIVAIDLGGHGRSGKDRKEWTVRAFGADIAAVIREENLRNVILIGHSMGGAAIIEAAALYPGRILGLVGVDTFHDLGAPLYTREQAEDIIAPFKAAFVQTTDGFVRGMFPPTAKPELVDEIAKRMSSAPPAVGVGTLRATLSYSPVETLKKVRLPIIAINADQYPVNLEGNRKLAAAFDVKIMRGLGHFVMIENAAEFNRLLEESISEIQSRR